MNIEIKNILPEDYKLVIEFYSKYGDKSNDWYTKKLKNNIISGVIVGKVCIIKETNEIIASYLCKIQRLLSNNFLKSVQSIDTLTAPLHRKGNTTSKLAKEVYKYLKSESFDCIYGLPSQRADKFFCRILKWEIFKPTYSYYVFIPVFILRFCYKLVNFFFKNKKSFFFSKEKVNLLKNFIVINKNCVENYEKEFYWVSYDNGFFSNIGLCRSGNNLNIFDKLYLLMLISSKTKKLFLRTYSTEQNNTANIFTPFSIKKKALDFSGFVFNDSCKSSLKQSSFEFIEFDTFGLD
jgi:hypothetical protein